MDTFSPDQREEGWGAVDDETTALPRRARRQFFNRRTAALGALVTCAIGFYAGIRVEKSQVAGSNSASGAGLGLAGSSGSGRAAGAAAASGLAAQRGKGGGAPSGGFGGANASFGTVSSVSGKTIYLTDTSGNTVKVKVSSSTKVSKTQSVSRHAIRPGDTIIVTGAAGPGATTTAATITDSGNRSGSSTGSGSGARSGSGSGSGSAVGSLFSTGG